MTRRTDDDFEALWRSFHDRSMTLLDDRSEVTCRLISGEQIECILRSLSTLLFGLDPDRKAIVTVDGRSALNIAVRGMQHIIHQRRRHRKQCTRIVVNWNAIIWGLKAIKSVVIHNPEGRDGCRRCGVFPVISDAVAILLSDGDDAQDLNVEVMDEAFTTVAAISLGNELNALQATLLFKSSVERLQKRTVCLELGNSNASSAASLSQKLHYLKSLFDVMETEQKTLFDRFGWDTAILLRQFSRIEKAEELLLLASGIVSNCSNDDDDECGDRSRRAEKVCCRALEELRELLPHTNLLRDLVCSIRDCRSGVRLLRRDFEGTLEDMEFCLNSKREQEQQTTFSRTDPRVTKWKTYQIDAWIGLDRLEQAEGTLHELILIAPSDQILKRKLKHIQRIKRGRVGLKRSRPFQTNSHLDPPSTVNFHETVTPDVEEKPHVGTLVKSLFGTGVVQEVRSCGLTKVRIESWLLLNGQRPTAFLMPESYSVIQ